MGKDFVAVFEFDPKHCIRQRFKDRPLYFYRIFFCHTCLALIYVSILGSFYPTLTVCSKCADNLLSFVTAVHLSPKISISCEPSLTMGSIAKTMPFFNLGPVPAVPKLGISGSSCIFLPIPWPTKSLTTE